MSPIYYVPSRTDRRLAWWVVAAWIFGALTGAGTLLAARSHVAPCDGPHLVGHRCTPPDVADPLPALELPSVREARGEDVVR